MDQEAVRVGLIGYGLAGAVFHAPLIASTPALRLASVAVLACGAVLLLWGRRLDALAIGDATARALGVHPDRFRIRALIVLSLGVGAVVAVSGGIGFVGLIVPHIARLCVGGAPRRLGAGDARI
jgi:iron complex transport system permease protein